MPHFGFAALHLIEELERTNRIETRVYRDPQDPFSLSDHVFIKLFAVSKSIFSLLLERLSPCLIDGLSPTLKLLVALRFYASGKHQQSIGNDVFISLSQTSVSRCIHITSKAIDTLLFNEFVKFPSTATEESKVQKEFYDATGFSGVLGVIDSTYVAIKLDNASMVMTDFVNRYGLVSLKVQLVTDSNMKILGVSASYPGSTRDTTIWSESEIRKIMSHRKSDTSWLLGNNNFPLEPWLLTPFARPSESELIFNSKHYAARDCMKKCKRLLRSRFRCLGQKTLQYAPLQISHIINACIILHNICLKHDVPFDSADGEEDKSGDNTDYEKEDNMSNGNEKATNDTEENIRISNEAESVRLKVLQSFL